MAKRDRIAQAILVGVLAAIALPIAAVITPLVFYLTAIPSGRSSLCWDSVAST